MPTIAERFWPKTEDDPYERIMQRNKRRLIIFLTIFAVIFAVTILLRWGLGWQF